MHQMRLLLRGLLKRCPRCGDGGVFSSWFTLREVCPRCRLRIEREEGYWVGAMALSIVITELLFVAFLAVAVILTWPDLPVVPLIIAGVALNIVFPIVSYPTMKTLWLATDLAYFDTGAGRPVPRNQSGSGTIGSDASAPHSDHEPS
jgi:uncharacterized protein (DUF983 family)